MRITPNFYFSASLILSSLSHVSIAQENLDETVSEASSSIPEAVPESIPKASGDSAVSPEADSPADQTALPSTSAKSSVPNTAPEQRKEAKAPQVVDRKNGFYFSLGKFSIDSEAAREEGVEDTATYFQFAWQAQEKNWLWGVGLSGLLYSDTAEFEQLVEDNSGDEFVAESDAQSVNIFGEGGYAYAPSPYVSLDALVGVELVLSSERSISNCTDCYSEDIDIDSGLYISPRVRLLAGETGFMIGLAYQHYLAADLDGGLMLTIGGRF